MSRFYGVIDGAARTQATRRGHTSLKTTAASWKGAIVVYLEVNDAGEETFEVRRIAWHGGGADKSALIAEGIL